MSSKNTNKLNVPQARAAMDKFKMEAANEEDVYPPQRIFPTLDFWLKYRKNRLSRKKPVFEVETSCLKQVYLCRGHSSHSCHRSGLVTISICLHLAQAVS